MQLELRQLVKLNDIVSRYDDIFVDMDNQHEYISARAKFTKILNTNVNVDLSLEELRVLQDILDVESTANAGRKKVDAIEAKVLYKEVSDAIIAEQRRD